MNGADNKNTRAIVTAENVAIRLKSGSISSAEATCSNVSEVAIAILPAIPKTTIIVSLSQISAKEIQKFLNLVQLLVCLLNCGLLALPLSGMTQHKRQQIPPMI